MLTHPGRRARLLGTQLKPISGLLSGLLNRLRGAEPAQGAQLRDIARSSPPRIYIGTVEVRTSPAPAPAPAPAPPPPTPQAPRHAPSAASVAPVTRGYGWRFGLVQG